RESAAYGFDVLSFFGASFGASDPEERLAIEVKANALAARPAFQLFLTDHEWSTASRLGRSYIFHLWDGVTAQPRLSSTRESPFILTPEALQTHLPSPPSCGEACCWKSSFILLCLHRLRTALFGLLHMRAPPGAISMNRLDANNRTRIPGIDVVWLPWIDSLRLASFPSASVPCDPS